MAFCSKCGAQVPEGTKFCPSCGNPVAAPTNGSAVNQASQPNMGQPNMNQNYNGQPAGGASKQPDFMNTLDITNQFHPQDIAENKVMAVLAYLGILWLIPFFAAKQSAFAKFHLKQGFLVVCAQVGYEIIALILCAIIKVPTKLYGFETGLYHTPGFVLFILWILRLAIWLMAILGIINAAQGKAKELPFIGKMASNLKFLN